MHLRPLTPFLLALTVFLQPAAAAPEDTLKVAPWHNSLEEALRVPSVVLKLNLSNRGLTSFPADILRLPNLRILILNHNQLSELPADLARLTQLAELELNHNAFIEFPRAVLDLAQLNELELSGNRLTSLPDDLDRLTQLTELEIQENDLTSLPAAVTRLAYLEELKADENRLTALPDELFALPSLQELTVSRNQITALPARLDSARSLRELDVSGNRLPLFPEALRTLNLSSCLIWQDTLARIPADSLAWFLARDQNDIDVFIQQLAEARHEEEVLHYFDALETSARGRSAHNQAHAALIGARAFRDLGRDTRARELAATAHVLFTSINTRVDLDDDHDAAPADLSVYANLREAGTLQALLETEARQAALRARSRTVLITGLAAIALVLIALWRVHLRLRATHATLSRQKEKIEEQAARLEQLNVTKDTLFSLIGHDLRGPLSAIGALSKRLRADPASSTTPRLLSLLEGTSLQLSAMLDNLLRWAQSQIREVRFEPSFVDLGAVVEAVVSQYRVMLDVKEITLETGIDRGLHVYGDVVLLETIVRNLLGNAIKFSETGCRIRITAATRDGEIVLEVADTGTGMSPAQVSGLFQTDSARSLEGTRGERGTGLGLLLSQDFALRHGGHLSARSTPGQGSVFHLSLPACALTA
jgi:signal transduction histidine kinase